MLTWTSRSGIMFLPLREGWELLGDILVLAFLVADVWNVCGQYGKSSK